MSVHFYTGGSAHKEGSRKEGGAEDHLAQQRGHNDYEEQEWSGDAVPRGRCVSGFMIRLLCLFLLWGGGAFHYIFIWCHFSSLNNCQPLPPCTPFLPVTAWKPPNTSAIRSPRLGSPAASTTSHVLSSSSVILTTNSSSGGSLHASRTY